MSQIHYLQLVLFAAAAAIAFGLITTYKILNLPKGNKKMIEIVNKPYSYTFKNYASKNKKISITDLTKDITKKLKKIVEAIDADRTGKLKAVIGKYESILSEDADGFKQELVESISQYLDAFLEESIPSTEIKEAVKNKKAIAVLEGIRSHLAVDAALEKDSIKEAVVDGKKVYS